MQDIMRCSVNLSEEDLDAIIEHLASNMEFDVETNYNMRYDGTCTETKTIKVKVKE